MGSEASTQNSKRPVRDGKLVDSTGTIDISIWSDHISLIKEGDFFEISNCTVKYYYGLKISTTTETIIKPAEKQNMLSSLKSAAQKYKMSSLTLKQCVTPKDVRAKSQETQNLKLWFVAQPATEQCSLKTVTLT